MIALSYAKKRVVCQAQIDHYESKIYELLFSSIRGIWVNNFPMASLEAA